MGELIGDVGELIGDVDCGFVDICVLVDVGMCVLAGGCFGHVGAGACRRGGWMSADGKGT